MSESRISAETEDDFHHFAVELEHRDGVVTAVNAQAVRHPWSLCPAAAARLQGLVGKSLEPTLSQVLSLLPIREHCTHLYDLACLSIVHAAKRTVRRRWDMTVDDRIDDCTRARLAVDGEETLDWWIKAAEIVAPQQISLKRNFVGWATAALSAEEAEAAILLRRAVFVSGGRRGDLDRRSTAADGARNMGGCFVMQPGVADRAHRVRGATRQFNDEVLPLTGASCSA